jgi:hypothetical protein
MKMKALLSNRASAAIQSDHEFSVYYKRKIANGKPKLVARKGVKNKIISRVCSVLQRGKPYIKNPTEYLY